jgi:hypothetical protein
MATRSVPLGTPSDNPATDPDIFARLFGITEVSLRVGIDRPLGAVSIEIAGACPLDERAEHYENRGLCKMIVVVLPFAVIACAEPREGTGCCRVCTTGKPCGNSCINRSYTCHKGPGCACYPAIAIRIRRPAWGKVPGGRLALNAFRSRAGGEGEPCARCGSSCGSGTLAAQV